MTTGYFDEMIEEFRTGSHDNTVDGKCCGCGDCCSRLLVLSEDEIEKLHRYIRKHSIKPCKHVLPTVQPVLDMCCPFLDLTKTEKKCTAYTARPWVCQDYVCNKTRPEAFDGKTRRIVDMWDEFFPGTLKPLSNYIDI